MTEARADAHDADWWYSYECVLCPVVGQGIVLDMRAPEPREEDKKETRNTESGHVSLVNEHEAWNVWCPLCGGLMRFGGKWRADADGYGSRGDSTAAVSLVRAATALERFQCAEQARAVGERYTITTAPLDPATAPRVAEECAQAIEGRKSL